MDQFWFLVFNSCWERVSSERCAESLCTAEIQALGRERRMDCRKAQCNATANSDLLLYELCIVLLKNVCIS